jgi:hypothetical protein
MKRQLFAYLRRHGLAATVIKTFLWGGVFIQKNLFLTLNRGRRQVFDKIYEKNYWANEESVSGRGSEMNQTENIRRELPKIFERYNCLSVFDAPCGDYNWMLHVVEKTKIRYVGGDIVESLVRRNNEQHQNANASFITLDICKDELPDADIMICRDCLFHLSYSDIEAFINNFVASNIPLLLVTSHKNTDGYFRNKNIRTGDFRLFDLFSQPFNFPDDVLYRFDDYKAPEPAREMCLFSRDQIAALAK